MSEEEAMGYFDTRQRRRRHNWLKQTDDLWTMSDFTATMNALRKTIEVANNYERSAR